MATYTERLQLVRDAIDEILLTGQEVSFEGRSWASADLDKLRALEKEYEQRSAAEQQAANGSAVGRNRIVYVEPQ